MVLFSHSDDALPTMAEFGSSGTAESEASNSCSFIMEKQFFSYKQLKEKLEVRWKCLKKLIPFNLGTKFPELLGQQRNGYPNE